MLNKIQREFEEFDQYIIDELQERVKYHYTRAKQMLQNARLHKKDEVLRKFYIQKAKECRATARNIHCIKQKKMSKNK